MPYALVIAGLILIVSGVRDTHEALGAQLKSDLTGDNNFARYALAIFAIGALGYIDKLRPASTAFMALVIISLVLSNKGVFNKLNDALKAGPETPPASYRELAAFAQFASDLDDATRKQLRHGQVVTELMKQKQYSPLKVSEMALTLFAINHGIYDDVSVEKALVFESGFLSYAKANCAEMLTRVESSGDLSKDDEQVLVKALNEFKTTFAV